MDLIVLCHCLLESVAAGSFRRELQQGSCYYLISALY